MSAKIPIALGFLFILTLASPAFADSQSNNLSLNMAGGVVSAGSQTYSISGGHLVSAVVLGQAIENSNAEVDYSVNAVVNGFAVSGSATFDISYISDGGTHYDVQGVATIVDAVPGIYFPLGCTGVACTSQIPSGFVAVADIKVSSCPNGNNHGHGHGNDNDGKCTTNDLPGVPMSFESSYLNPFGGPIFFASMDSTIAVVATYTTSRVTWTGIQLGGGLTGSLAGSPVSGSFLMTVNAVEDLRAGYELDHGTISFVTNNPAVTASGSFWGLSNIPKGGTDCSLPTFPGTCLITGFSSSGLFSQTNSLGGSIFGRYSTTWTAPAVAFSSSVSAIVKQPGK
jgi:hypothetical protein